MSNCNNERFYYEVNFCIALKKWNQNKKEGYLVVFGWILLATSGYGIKPGLPVSYVKLGDVKRVHYKMKLFQPPTMMTYSASGNYDTSLESSDLLQFYAWLSEFDDNFDSNFQILYTQSNIPTIIIIIK